MNPALRRAALWLAPMLPALGIAALVVQAEIAVRSGQVFRIPIRGYDPRDLMHGHYLRYQFDFNWQGDDSCTPELDKTLSSGTDGTVTREGRLSPECCLCLSDAQTANLGPAVRQIHCNSDERADCTAWIRSKDVMPPSRYFVPEEHAEELNRRVTDGPAAIELSVVRGKAPAIRELYLGMRPWREALRVSK